MHKKGELSNQELLEIILATVCILVLVFLLYNLISLNFDKTEKTSESYFKNLIEAVSLADKGGTGTFGIWQEEEEVKYYLVYFAGKTNFEYANLKFNSLGVNQNHICICSVSKKIICDFCENLGHPAKLDNSEIVQFSLGANQKININKASVDNFYRFTIAK